MLRGCLGTYFSIENKKTKGLCTFCLLPKLSCSCYECARQTRHYPTVGFSTKVPPLVSPTYPQMLGDADTLASRNISDGVAVHLFQRPKTAATTAAGGGATSVVSTAQQPGRLHDFPPVLLQVQGAGAGGSSGATGYVNAHWEVEGPRKQIRFLASFLLLISVLQVSNVCPWRGKGTCRAGSHTVSKGFLS